MKTMYYAYYSMNTVEEVTVESETPQLVKRSDRRGRDKKNTEYGSYHDSKSDAVQALKDNIQTKIDALERQVKYRNDDMNKVIKLYGE